MTSSLAHQPRRGLGLAFAGGLVISFDIPLIRLAGSDPYFVMGARGIGMVLVLWLYWRFFADRTNMPKILLADRYFITIGALFGLTNICFTLAVFNTSTANVVFILAFNAMLVALLSWPLIGEKPGRHTWLAIFATLLGVGIIVGEGLGNGNLLGDGLALACACLLALSITLTRKSGKDLSLAPAFGGVVAAAFALPMILWASSLPAAPVWLMLDALVLLPLAGIMLWLAPRYISAPQVALFYLLETVLTPIWAWFVFTEVPSMRVFVGGTIVIVAISAHAGWELNARRRVQPQPWQQPV